MEKKVIKKLLAILMIITILATDFFVLGSSLITYATNQIESAIEGQPNIEFSAYFINDDKQEVASIEKSVKSGKLQLYAKISVKKEGYFNGGVISLQNSNFNLISADKGIVEENTVKLNQISNDQEVEVILEVEPIFSDKMSADMVLNANVALEGKYVSSENEEGEQITVSRDVAVKYTVDKSAEGYLKTDIITNKVFSIGEGKKRIIQLLIESGLLENQYPVENTTLTINLPKLSEKGPEDVNVMPINNTTQISSLDWKVGNENAVVTLSNAADKNKEISWNQKQYDQVVVTLIYDAVDATKVEITTNSELKVHNSGNKYNATYTKGIENQELDNTIMANQEITTSELYKGKIYAKTEKDYETKTTLVVTNEQLASGITINEGSDKFILKDETTLNANSKYITTKINLQDIKNIFGEDGSITIKSGEQEIKLDKTSPVDESGNIVIRYGDLSETIEITTTAPKTSGILEIKHVKTIAPNDYSRAQIQAIKEIQTQASVKGKNSESNPTEARLEAKETISKAELSILKGTQLSTENENSVELGITLVTDGEQYDLFSNPEITLTFPDVVEDIKFNTTPIIQNVSEKDNLPIECNSDGNVVKIKVTGDQTTYATGEMSELYIPLDLNVILAKLAPSKTSKITMEYTNANASQYVDGGKIEKDITVAAPTGLVKWYEVSSNANKSTTQDLVESVLLENAGNKYEFNIAVLNNTEALMSDVKILVKLPTIGNTEDTERTLETLLETITFFPGEKIYYTENPDATSDIENTANGWTEQFTKNSKSILMELSELAVGNNFRASFEVQIPTNIQNGLKTYTQYEVIYDSEGATQTQTSRKIGLEVHSQMESTLTAQVGQETLKNGDTVKEGEVIKYTATVTNYTKQTLENVVLKAEVPTGTVVVEPKKAIAENSEDDDKGTLEINQIYYKELSDITEISEVIGTLAPGQTYVKQYEVRVKTDNTTGTEISNQVTATYNELTAQSDKITHKLEKSEIRVTINRDNETIRESGAKVQLLAGGAANYSIYIENLSDKEIANLELEILSDTYKIITVATKGAVYNENKITIGKIPAKGILSFEVNGKILEEVVVHSISATVTDSNNEIYRSNGLIEELPKIGATVTLTSLKNGKQIQEGDTVAYNITVNNTGEYGSNITLIDDVPEYLDIQSIVVNGKTKYQSTNPNDKTTYIDGISNDRDDDIKIEPGQKANITIKCKVKYIPLEDNGKEISNIVKVQVEGIQKASAKVTHILKANMKEEEKIKNIISGTAWLDLNQNGQKDSRETAVSGVKVKLYNVSTNYFVSDETGNILEQITDSEGKYRFTNIENGSYKIVFEYNTNKYEFTKYLANGVDTSINSKATTQKIIVNGSEKSVIATDVIEVKENALNINIGLIEKGAKPPVDDGEQENPDVKTIKGIAWLDKDRDGQRDENEVVLSGIKVKLYDVSTNNYLTEKVTGKNGEYTFDKVKKGSYIVVFEFNTEEYELTTYLVGIDESKNSKAVLRNININGEQKTLAVTDTINVQENIANINIGLREKLIFDLELNKYISRIVVQTNQKTKAYDYENSTFEKVEIHRKQIDGALVVLEYSIKVKNTGEMAGYAKNIVDYLPSGLTFSSELNTDWYLSGSYLYTKSLENVELLPGEEKEVKLILTKNMKGDNVGLINNRAEIYQDYNQYGNLDIDSVPNNQVEKEDDIGSVDVIIMTATGGSITAYIILLMINMVLIGIAIKLMIKNKIITIPTKKRGE